MDKMRTRAAAAVVVANLLLFLAVVTLPAFQAAHHHWIFPIFAVLLASQWALTFVPVKFDRFLDRRLLRGSVVSTLVFLLVIGITRHATILACFDGCSFKLAAAALIAGLVFLIQALARDKGFWDPLRANVAAAGALLWALALVLRGLHLTHWLSGLLFAILAALFWLGRASAPFLIASLGVMAALAVQATANEYAIIALGTIVCVVLPLGAAARVDSWLAKRRTGKDPSLPAGPLGPRLAASALRIAAAVAVLAGIGRFVVGPLTLVTDPAKRRAYLLTMAPKGPVRDPKELSELAARLRGHVVMLSQTIGERDAFSLKGRDRARDYVRGRLTAAGYAPKILPYESRFMPGVTNGTAFHNVEAALRVRSPEPRGAWIVGAHYDSAPGTPGADDNASGVAVLLELARLMKERHPGREIRFVAFGTEEPPSFGSRNMGSWHYASRLKDDGVGVHGAVVLETLGYFNSRPGSQLYPPFLQLFFPDHGDFIGAVGDVSSRGLLSRFELAWKRASRFPLICSILPGPFSSLALSDQLNFWELGFPAVMVSDTAFYRNANYHESTDVPDTLDYEKMAEVTTALAAVLEEAQ
ncbi:MAG: M28 family peptidase [Elusimicrobia bacterium]|nr:M28 family peptidase [Elusimicrobiota bacterium]